MPNFLIKSPSGEEFNVTAPEGTTEADALARVKAQYGARTEQPAPPEAPQPPLSLGQAGKSAVKNIPASALQFGKDIIHPILHPIETGENLYNLGAGLAEKTGLKASTGKEAYPDAVGQFFAQRYGGWDKFKQTLATDPVGLAADASILATGGGGLAARAPGLAGTVGKAVGTVGRAIDPLNVPIKGAELAGRGVAAAVGSKLGTGTGGELLTSAARAGAEGGTRAEAFQGDLRQRVPVDAVVNDLRETMRGIQTDLGADYKSAMRGVRADPTVLDFQKIDNALARVNDINVFRGRSGTATAQEISPATLAVRTKINDLVDHWRNLDPAEFHTAIGMDALKRQIGNVREATEFGSPERTAADTAYRAIRQTVVDQFPEYAKVMQGYEKGQKILSGLEKELSLNPNTAIDTTLRKLQTVLKDNVSGTFSRRRQLAEYLMRSGSPYLQERLAGQALSQWAPKGLGKVLGTEILALGGAAVGAAMPAVALTAGAALPFMSPRIMGEAAYYAGKATNLPGRPVLQGSRLIDQLEPRKMVEGEARSALGDENWTAGQRLALKTVASGKGTSADIMAVKSLLELHARRSYGGVE